MSCLFKCCNCNSHRKKYEHQLDTIQIEQFRDSDATLDTFKGIELYQSGKHDEYLQGILNKINQNQSIVHINECPGYIQIKSTASHRDQIADIETALVNNLNNHSEYPSDHMHCLLVNHMYFSSFKPNTDDRTRIDGLSEADPLVDQQFLANANDAWKKLTAQNWFIYETYRLTGLKNIVYMNETTKQIVLAIQGPRLEFDDYFMNDFGSQVDAWKPKLIDHILSLLFHVKKCVDLSRRVKYSLSFAGFSIGGWLAQLGVLFCHEYFGFARARAVAFESIGLSECIYQLNLEKRLKNKATLAQLPSMKSSYPLL